MRQIRGVHCARAERNSVAQEALAPNCGAVPLASGLEAFGLNPSSAKVPGLCNSVVPLRSEMYILQVSVSIYKIAKDFPAEKISNILYLQSGNIH